MKLKIKARWILLITIWMTGMPLSYDNFISTRIIWLSFAFTLILALMFTIITEGPYKKTFLLTVSGFIIAIIIKIIIDGISDPWTHNLWFFEIVYDGTIASIASIAGVGSGLLIRKILYKRRDAI